MIFLERKRIETLLEKALKSQVAMIVAGAGYGKTHAVQSLVSAYREKYRNMRISWLQVSERDNDSEQFWEDFTQSISLLSPDTAATLRKITFPQTLRQFEVYQRIPSKDVVRGDRYIFVYDDFHCIQNKDVLTFMERNISSPFPNICSVLISRTDPSLNLMALESRDKLSRLTEEELKFSMDEMLDYYSLLGLKPDKTTADMIYRDTEGWAFAVYLAGRNLANLPEGASYIPQATRSNISKLIEQEIVSSISAPLRKLLIKISLLEYIPASLMAELEPDKSIIADLERISSFITLDPYTNIYRIHTLLLDYLRSLQNELSDDEKKDIWRKTGKWYDTNEQKIIALRYYELVGDYDAILNVYYSLPLTLPRQTARLLIEIFERAEPGYREKNLMLTNQIGRLYLNLVEFDKAEDHFLPIIRKLEINGEICRDPDKAKILMISYCNLGFLHLLKSNYTDNYDFADLFEKTHLYSEISSYREESHWSVVSLPAFVIRVNNPERGRMEAYIQALKRAIPHMAESLGGCYWGGGELAEGELAFFRGELVRAEELFLIALTKAREKNQFEIESRSLGYLVRIALHRGNGKSVQDILKQHEALLENKAYFNRYYFYDIYTSSVFAHLGIPEKCADWLRNDFEDVQINSLVYGAEVAAKAKYHMSVREYTSALAIVGSKETEYGPHAFLFGRIFALVVEAVCRYRLGERDESFRALEKAWALAEPNKLLMFFTEMGRDMRSLAAAAMEKGGARIDAQVLDRMRLSASAYAKRLALVEKIFKPPVKHKRMVSRLSQRELEVLTCLYQGLTGEEIAQETNLSINTVKSIIKRIYNKLGALNKADAIRITLDLGLIRE